MKETSCYQFVLLRIKVPDSLINRKVPEVYPIELQEFLNKYSETASKSYTCKMFSSAIFIKAAATYSHPDMEELQAASESFRDYVQAKKWLYNKCWGNE